MQILEIVWSVKLCKGNSLCGFVLSMSGYNLNYNENCWVVNFLLHLLLFKFQGRNPDLWGECDGLRDVPSIWFMMVVGPLFQEIHEWNRNLVRCSTPEQEDMRRLIKLSLNWTTDGHLSFAAFTHSVTHTHCSHTDMLIYTSILSWYRLLNKNSVVSW